MKQARPRKQLRALVDALLNTALRCEKAGKQDLATAHLKTAMEAETEFHSPTESDPHD